MSAVLIHADSIRSGDMRHAVPVAVPDAFLYLESNGARAAVVTAFEVPRIAAADPAIETIPFEALGSDELLAAGMPRDEIALELCARGCARFGISSAVVPADFPLELADHLRANGIEISVDRDLFQDRRRCKTPREVVGLRRAQRACEAGLDVARAMLRSAEVVDGRLVLGGEPLTCERVKVEVERAFSAGGAAADEFIVSHGAQTAIGHEPGSGPIAAGESIVFDLFPRDRETGVYTDMTRTYVVGEVPDELQHFHELSLEALRLAAAAVKPGVNGRALMQIVCDFFAGHGYPTPMTKQPGEVLSSGFFHGLGHGVGLDVHEKPSLSLSGDDLVVGDVITLEPGLYRAGYGGVRLEDILLVTENGAERVTSYPYGLSP
jgi:Xaa-Pro aminopeptidase